MPRLPRPSLGPPTRVAGLTRRQAAVILLLGLALLVWAVAAAQRFTPWVFSTIGIIDLDLYREVVTRVHAGERYYDFVGDALTSHGYPISSTFNWRLPTYAWLLGSLPDPAYGRIGLVVLALASVVLTAHCVLSREVGPTGTIAGIILLLGGAFGWAIYEPDAYLTTETWCEAILLLSLSGYAARRWPFGVAAALAALALRELVLPYCVAAAGLAWWYDRRAEVRTWLVALAVAGALYTAHAAEVALHVEGATPAVRRWLDPTGIWFLLRTAVMNVWFRGGPPTLTAIILTAGVIGLAGWRGETGARLRACTLVYLAPLTVIRGWDYWGFIYTPFVMLGLVRAPATIRDLIAAVARRRHPVTSEPRPDPEPPATSQPVPHA
jgi:hypothetical protein